MAQETKIHGRSERKFTSVEGENYLVRFNVCHPEVFNTYINIQWCISQTQQNFIVFVIVLGQHVSILIESSSCTPKNTDPYLAMFKMCCVIPSVWEPTAHFKHC